MLDIPNLSTFRVTGLLRLYSDILQELSLRDVCRSTNNPVADVAELLVVRALGLSRAQRSTKGYDAKDSAGKRYEIKSRRITAHNSSRMLSAIRDCEAAHFDYLAGVLFAENFCVLKACLVPHETVLALSKYRKHTNAHIFELKDELWALPGVVDITKKIGAELETIDLAPISNRPPQQWAQGCHWCDIEKVSLRRLDPGQRRECPLCERTFNGHGWGGIDAHWRANHSSAARYEDFWAGLCDRHRR